MIDEAWAQGEPRQSNTVFASPCTFERLAADEMPGGHLVALSRPAELAERLSGYAAELGLEQRPLPSDEDLGVG